MKEKLVVLFGIVISLTVLPTFAQETKRDPDPKIAELALAVIGKDGSAEEKTRRLVNWINTNFEWSATDYENRTPEEVIARRAGNCFELANVLEVLLDAAKIRSRWVAEINIQPRDEGRQQRAAKKVAESGNHMSVFGLMHNDHRWLEVYEEENKSWIPADPAVGVVGVNDWIAARLAFTQRKKPAVPAVAETVETMLVPVVVVALKSKRGKPIEDRSEYYLHDGFDKFYGNKLRELPSWGKWKRLTAQFSAIASAAFEGEANLHEQGKFIEQIAQVYENMKTEATRKQVISLRADH